MSQTQSAAAIAGTLKQGKVVHVNTGQSFSGVSFFFNHWSVLVSLKTGTLKLGKVGHNITGQSLGGWEWEGQSWFH